MNNKLTKIFTNILLLGSFMLTYFLDLTGLALHQLLGVAAGVFLIVHIISHAKWIKQVSIRFFQKLSGKVRFYYLLDFFLLVLITTMIVTGILISTWLTVNFETYPVLRKLHILSSIAGLVLLVVKLVYHWKFFANLFRRKNVSKNQPVKAPTVAGHVYSRRDALKTIGAISAVGIFGLAKAASAMISTTSQSVLPDPGVSTTKDEMAEESIASSTNGSEPESDLTTASQSGGKQRRNGHGKASSASVNSEEYALSTPQPDQETTQVEAQATPIPNTQDCVIRCPRGCAFPGECGHYIDENHNKLCDLGECLVL